MNRIFRTFLLALGITVALAGSAAAQTFYVATNGRDDWSGRLATPSTAGNDGPFATIGKAQAAVRLLRTAPQSGPVTVSIRGGVYTLAAPIEFTPADSGTSASPTIYEAYPGERPIFSGGRRVTGWTKTATEVWSANLPSTSSMPRQFFVGGERRMRARFPNSGFLTTAGYWPGITDPNAQSSHPMAARGFRYRAGDLRSWERVAEANLVFLQLWSASIHSIEAIDETARTVTLREPTVPFIGAVEPHLRYKRYYVENVPEALDSPGEWYADSRTGKILYWPLSGENLSTADAVVPVLRHLARFQGTFAEPVSHVILRGLAFHHTDWAFTPGTAIAGTYDLPYGAVELRFARNVKIEDCEIAHVGEQALFVDSSSDNVIARSRMHDSGASGIFVTGWDPRSDRNVIENNFVHEGSRVFHSATGMLLFRGSHNRITRNEVTRFSGGGIQVVGGMGYGPPVATDNTIEGNHVHHVVEGLLSDITGIYTAGESPGTLINNNEVHDVDAYTYGENGFYADEGTSGITVAANLVYRVGTGYQHNTGRDNVVRDNILITQNSAFNIANEEPTNSITAERNIVIPMNGQVLDVLTARGRYHFDHNLYWSPAGTPRFSGLSFAEWQQLGQDLHSVVGDPKIGIDGELSVPAQALPLGFAGFVRSASGLYGDPSWTTLPGRLAPPRSKKIPTPGWDEVTDDFEREEAGDPPGYAAVFVEGAGSSIAVSRSAASKGVQSLAFTVGSGTAPAARMAYLPYLSGGTGFLEFDVLLGSGRLAIGLSETGFLPPMTGPNLFVTQERQLLANGHSLMTLPDDRWVNVRLVFPLSVSGSGTYSIAVTVEEEPARTFHDIPFDSPSFSRLTWASFGNATTLPGTFHLDNIRWGLLPARARSVRR